MSLHKMYLLLFKQFSHLQPLQQCSIETGKFANLLSFIFLSIDVVFDEMYVRMLITIRVSQNSRRMIFFTDNSENEML